MLARSLFLGINQYFAEVQDKNLFIFNKDSNLTYLIQSGDTLSEIAIRFGVPVMDIINLNMIRDEAIFPGQKIQIPHHQFYEIKLEIPYLKLHLNIILLWKKSKV